MLENWLDNVLGLGPSLKGPFNGFPKAVIHTRKWGGERQGLVG